LAQLRDGEQLHASALLFFVGAQGSLPGDGLLEL
jgi:hypothetical protein